MGGSVGNEHLSGMPSTASKERCMPRPRAAPPAACQKLRTVRVTTNSSANFVASPPPPLLLTASTTLSTPHLGLLKEVPRELKQLRLTGDPFL
jgi:hypothetical protein